MSDDRLNRIEVKLDKLAEAIVSLARMEERMITLFKRMETYEEKQAEVTDRVATIERTSEGRNHVVRMADKLFWILITAAVGASFVYFRGWNG